AEPYGPLERISGVAVTNRPLGARFPNGLMVANDRINANASEDFKLFAWEDVAGPAGLVVDTKWSARGK
ncbi:MAG TPA: hypothetical protein VK986_12045, partial [Tepidisphaeraceae bacterium]|nr:hypothetical protein [Tepidisphaeraceae bacterium]